MPVELGAGTAGGQDDVAVGSARTGSATLRPVRLRLPSGSVVRLAGCPVLSPVGTLVHLSRLLRADALACAVDAALHRRLTTTGRLRAAAAQRSWCPGAPAPREAVRSADGRAESPPETLARLLLLPALPGLTPQVPVFDGSGRCLARLDLAEEELRLAVEVDGARWHSGAQMVARDRRRDSALERLGWRRALHLAGGALRPR